MIFESIFMIRGVDFGQDFGRKLIFSIIAILMCCYDWKTNEKRKDFEKESEADKNKSGRD